MIFNHKESQPVNYRLAQEEEEEEQFTSML